MLGRAAMLGLHVGVLGYTGKRAICERVGPHMRVNLLDNFSDKLLDNFSNN